MCRIAMLLVEYSEVCNFIVTTCMCVMLSNINEGIAQFVLNVTIVCIQSGLKSI